MNKRIVFFTTALLASIGSFATAPFAMESGTTAPATAQPVTAADAKTDLTKEQATEMALKAHPGKVTKTYEDTKEGKKAWEVKIKGDDGKKWEVYYDIKTGELIAEESE